VDSDEPLVQTPPAMSLRCGIKKDTWRRWRPVDELLHHLGGQPAVDGPGRGAARVHVMHPDSGVRGRDGGDL